MASDSTNRQMTDLKDMATRVDSDKSLLEMLSVAMRMLVVDGNFSAAAVSVVRNENHCETLAAAGPADLVGTRFPLASYHTELAAAQAWGVLRFVAVEHSAQIGVLHSARTKSSSGAVTSGSLYAQLNSDSDQLIGMISIELVDNAPQPGIAAQRMISDISELVANAIEKQFGLAVETPKPEVDEGARHAPEVAERVTELAALQDPDTGLPNRRGLDVAVSSTIERVRSDGSTAALLYCVLEEFDSIAESLGTEVANEVMRRVSKRLQDSVRGNDIVARVSPDTMAIVAGQIAPQDTSSMVARLRRALAKVHIVEDEVIRLRGSVGVAILDGDATDAETTLRLAERACEVARDGVSGTYVLYSRYARAPLATPQVR